MGDGRALEEQWDWEVLATNLRVEGALVDVLALLADLDVVVFKGPVLTKMIYGDLRRRASADNDIWVRRPQVFEALERLCAQGYRPIPGLDARAALRRVGQVALFRGDDPSVDLHAEPFSGRFFSVKAERILAHLRPCVVGDVSLLTFDEPLAFVHMVAHFVQHHFERALLGDLRSAWIRWSENPEISKTVFALAPETCSMPALALVLTLVKEEVGNEWAARRCAIPVGLISMSDRVRVGVVSRFLSRGVDLSPLVRQFLALFLVAPVRLPREIMRATLLEEDDLVSRYGPGRYEVLLLRHMRAKLGG